MFLQARESEIFHPCKHLQSTYIRLPKFKQLYSFNYLTVEVFSYQFNFNSQGQDPI